MSEREEVEKYVERYENTPGVQSWSFSNLWNDSVISSNKPVVERDYELSEREIAEKYHEEQSRGKRILNIFVSITVFPMIQKYSYSPAELASIHSWLNGYPCSGRGIFILRNGIRNMGSR